MGEAPVTWFAEGRTLYSTLGDPAMDAYAEREYPTAEDAAAAARAANGEPVRCRRCGRWIFDGDSGWYYQAPIQVEYSDATMTFVDRITDCGGVPHEPSR